MEVFPNGLKETQASILYGMFKTWFKSDYGGIGDEPEGFVHAVEKTLFPTKSSTNETLMVDRCTRSSLLQP